MPEARRLQWLESLLGERGNSAGAFDVKSAKENRQNKMKNVQGRVTAGVARMILSSADSGKTNIQKKPCLLQRSERRHSECDKEAQVVW